MHHSQGWSSSCNLLGALKNTTPSSGEISLLEESSVQIKEDKDTEEHIKRRVLQTYLLTSFNHDESETAPGNPPLLLFLRSSPVSYSRGVIPYWNRGSKYRRWCMLSRLQSPLRQTCDFGLYSMIRTDWTSHLWHRSSAPSQPPSSPGRRWPQGGSQSQRVLSKLHQLGRGGGPASRNKPESPSRRPSAPWTRWRQKRHSRRGRQGTRSSRGGTAWENPPWWEEAGGRRETEGRGYQRWGRWIPPGPPWQAAPLGDWCAAWKDPAEAGFPGESSSTGRCLDNSESDWVWWRSSLDLGTKDRAVLQQSSERFMIFFFTVCKASMNRTCSVSICFRCCGENSPLWNSRSPLSSTLWPAKISSLWADSLDSRADTCQDQTDRKIHYFSLISTRKSIYSIYFCSRNSKHLVATAS